MELPPRSGPNSAPALSPGQAAEQAAAEFLAGQGFRVVAANYRSRHGEIDLIARKGGLLLFVEVRLRRHRDYGGAAASVTPRKQQKIIATAGAFLHHHPGFSRCDCRFDVIALQASGSGWQLEWIPSAFTT